jgi:hypothetical protein
VRSQHTPHQRACLVSLGPRGIHIHMYMYAKSSVHNRRPLFLRRNGPDAPVKMKRIARIICNILPGHANLAFVIIGSLGRCFALCAVRRGWIGETDGRFLALSTPAVAAAVGPHLMHVLTQQPNDSQLAALDLVINFIWVVSFILKVNSQALSLFLSEKMLNKQK